MKKIKIGDRLIGENEPCFVIAEGGNNHNGELALALKLIDAAKESGADAVKFQKRTIHKILTKEAFHKPYFGPNSYGETYGEHRLKLELGESEWRSIFEHCKKVDLMCFASPWDEESVDFLEKLNVPLYKVPSADLTNIPLVRYIAAKNKPVLLSTGMSTLEEVDEAVNEILKINPQLVVMHCVSTYPFETELANLRMISVLQNRYPDLIIGYSGHEKSGWMVSLAAVTSGAKVLERHFTLDRTMKGTDHAASLEPKGLAGLIDNIRIIEKSFGDGVKIIHPDEIPVRNKLAKSVTAAKPIKKGEKITPDMLIMKCPGTGLTGKYFDQLVGKIAQKDMAEEELFADDSLSWPV